MVPEIEDQIRGRTIPVSSATISAWRSQPVFARTRRTWVRTVSGDKLPSVAMAAMVFPDASFRWGQIEQGLYQFDRRRLGPGHGGEHQGRKATHENVTRGEPNRNDMR